MRSGVCGQRGSGGNAFSVCALAMPTRSVPSSRARAFTRAAVIAMPLRNGDGVRAPTPLQRVGRGGRTSSRARGATAAWANELMADQSQGNTLLSNLPRVFYLSMRAAARSQPRKRVPGAAKVAAHLAASPHEFVVTRFEQGLICAAAAFYRFYGSLLGREGRVHNVSGQDNAIL